MGPLILSRHVGAATDHQIDVLEATLGKPLSHRRLAVAPGTPEKSKAHLGAQSGRIEELRDAACGEPGSLVRTGGKEDGKRPRGGRARLEAVKIDRRRDQLDAA